MTTRAEGGAKVFDLVQLLSQGEATTRSGAPLRVVAHEPDAEGQNLIMLCLSSRTLETYSDDGRYQYEGLSAMDIINN